MKPKLRLALNMSGCGLQQLNQQNIDRFFMLTYPLNEICLLQSVFCPLLINKYGKHHISTGGGAWYPPQACKFLKLRHHLHSLFDKSIMERTMQYIKERIECFEYYFPCKKNKCKLKHIEQ